jgi:transposase
VHHHSEAFVRLDTSKLRNAIGVAEDGRGRHVRYLSEIDTSDAATSNLAAKLVAKPVYIPVSSS